jgi:hypothetical protein
MIPLDYSKQLRRKLADGKVLDDALAELRAEGVSIFECIIAVEKIRKCGLAEAKQIVHFSPAWADMRAGHEKFHQELEEIAKEIVDEDAEQDSAGNRR